jgi:hypothetical protein
MALLVAEYKRIVYHHEHAYALRTHSRNTKPKRNKIFQIMYKRIVLSYRHSTHTSCVVAFNKHRAEDRDKINALYIVRKTMIYLVGVPLTRPVCPASRKAPTVSFQEAMSAALLEIEPLDSSCARLMH